MDSNGLKTFFDPLNILTKILLLKKIKHIWWFTFPIIRALNVAFIVPSISIRLSKLSKLQYLTGRVPFQEAGVIQAKKCWKHEDWNKEILNLKIWSSKCISKLIFYHPDSGFHSNPGHSYSCRNSVHPYKLLHLNSLCWRHKNLKAKIC